ncbi:MAG: hypothetical protein JXR53_00300 [Bacteroidales bacterium]|nr:hypothetical protein [Bacteroidales bacterium]
MKRNSIIVLLLGIVFLSASTGCNDGGKVQNEVKSLITLKDGIKSETVLPDSLNLPLMGLNHTEGSVSSLEMTFLDTIDNMEYKLSIILPACPKFSSRYKNGGGLEFNIDKFPYTISGEDYQPYPNALYETPEEVRCVFEMRNTTTKEYNYEFFELTELRIDEAFEKDMKITFRFTFLASSEFYDAAFTVDITECEYEMIEVD